MITVVDYGMGNLRNVRRAFESLGTQVEVTYEPDRLRRAGKLVLPGVGAFGEAMRRIDALGLTEAIVGHARAGKPLLGICLGMQLIFESSEENPGVRGLGLVKGEVRRFNSGVKIPHIGWNDVLPRYGATLFGGVTGAGCFYFVHSYAVYDSPAACASTSYGREFASAVEQDNLFGFQFHPEKSQDAGLRLLRNFMDLEL